MATTAYKFVTPEYESLWLQTIVERGLEDLILTYTPDTTVTPDPELELAVKLAHWDPAMHEKAYWSAGLYAHSHQGWFPGPSPTRKAALMQIDAFEPLSSHWRVIEISFEDADLLETRPTPVAGKNEYRLRSCTVVADLGGPG